jgi:hypothetical protein
MTAPPLTSPPTTDPQPPPPAERRDRLAPGRLALGVLLLLLGGAWLLEVLDLADIRWQTLLASAVAAIGAVLLLTARRRSTDGLIGLGIVLSVALVVVSSLPSVPFTGGVGDRDVRVERIAELAPSYELGAGTLTLDLRDLALPVGATEVSASVGTGDLRVRVPREVTVEVAARTGAGNLDVLGERREGLAPQLDVRSTGGRSTLVLDLSVGLGSIEVTR